MGGAPKDGAAPGTTTTSIIFTTSTTATTTTTITTLWGFSVGQRGPYVLYFLILASEQVWAGSGPGPVRVRAKARRTGSAAARRYRLFWPWPWPWPCGPNLSRDQIQWSNIAWFFSSLGPSWGAFGSRLGLSWAGLNRFCRIRFVNCEENKHILHLADWSCTSYQQKEKIIVTNRLAIFLCFCWLKALPGSVPPSGCDGQDVRDH